jgi:hypothetical protein
MREDREKSDAVGMRFSSETNGVNDHLRIQSDPACHSTLIASSDDIRSNALAIGRLRKSVGQ